MKPSRKIFLEGKNLTSDRPLRAVMRSPSTPIPYCNHSSSIRSRR
ncbi:hypothetical protein [Nostoc sp.]